MPPAEADSQIVAQQQLQSAKPDGDIWSDFRDSALYSLAQRPLDGVTQLIDQTTGSKLQKEVQFLKPPTEAEFGSGRWLSQQLGAGVGMLPWVWGISKGVSKGATSFLESHTMANIPGAFSKVGITTAEGLAHNSVVKLGVTGAIYDGILKPVGPESAGEGFSEARQRNALTGAATFGTLALSGQLLSAAGKSSWGSKMMLSSMDKGLLAAASENKIAAAAITAVPAGVLSANMDATRFHGRFATGEEMLKTTTQMAVVGAGLSILPDGSGSRRSFNDTISDAGAGSPPTGPVAFKLPEPPPKVDISGFGKPPAPEGAPPPADALSTELKFFPLNGQHTVEGPPLGMSVGTRAAEARTETPAEARTETPAEARTEQPAEAPAISDADKSRLSPEQLAQYELARRSDGADQKWTEVYQEAFPASERQAESELLKHMQSGHMELSETRSPSGEPVSFIISEVFDPTATRPKIILNAYTATRADQRSNGIGSATMAETIAQLKVNHPDAPAFFAEIESPREAGITAEQVTQRQRRWDFYERNGWKKAEGFEYAIPQFQTRTTSSGQETTYASWRHPLQMELIYYPLNSTSMKGSTIRDAVTTIWGEGYGAKVDSPAAQRSLSTLENDKDY